ncbi:MAG: mechanosensitive ion channel, partial [Candidatus Marinimicrobia bacterium]|nr:mechanosensitive ion channel [Candidatus Neomarinimicrobiota bacterium]
MIELFESWFSSMNIGAESINFLAHSLAVLAVLILAVIANFITKKYLISLLNKIVNRTTFEWDDILLKRRVFNNLAHLAPAIVVYLLAPIAFAGSQDLVAIVLSIAQIYMIAVVVLVIDAVLNSVLDIYQAKQYSREIPIKGFVQVAKIIIYFLGFIFIISILLNKTPWYLLSGLGALTAVLMLIFRDAILGFVAG